jgi:hypothetical protein
VIFIAAHALGRIASHPESKHRSREIVQALSVHGLRAPAWVDAAGAIPTRAWRNDREDGRLGMLVCEWMEADHTIHAVGYSGCDEERFGDAHAALVLAPNALELLDEFGRCTDPDDGGSFREIEMTDALTTLQRSIDDTFAAANELDPLSLPLNSLAYLELCRDRLIASCVPVEPG